MPESLRTFPCGNLAEVDLIWTKLLVANDCCQILSSPKLQNTNKNYYKYICIVACRRFCKDKCLFAKLPMPVQCRVASDNPTPNSIPYFPRSWIESQVNLRLMLGSNLVLNCLRKEYYYHHLVTYSLLNYRAGGWIFKILYYVIVLLGRKLMNQH